MTEQEDKGTNKMRYKKFTVKKSENPYTQKDEVVYKKFRGASGNINPNNEKITYIGYKGASGNFSLTMSTRKAQSLQTANFLNQRGFIPSCSVHNSLNQAEKEEFMNICKIPKSYDDSQSNQIYQAMQDYSKDKSKIKNEEFKEEKTKIEINEPTVLMSKDKSNDREFSEKSRDDRGRFIQRYMSEDINLYIKLFMKFGRYMAIAEELKRLGIKTPDPEWIAELIKRHFQENYEEKIWEKEYDNFIKKYSRPAVIFTEKENQFIWGLFYDQIKNMNFNVETILGNENVEKNIRSQLYLTLTDKRKELIKLYGNIINYILDWDRKLSFTEISLELKKEFDYTEKHLIKIINTIANFFARTKNFDIKSRFYDITFSDEEEAFFKRENLDINKLNSKWEWVSSRPDLASKYYKEIIYQQLNRIPSEAELLELGYRGFLGALKKIGKSIEDLREDAQISGSAGYRIKQEPYKYEIVAFLKQLYQTEPWKIQDYGNISKREEQVINSILDKILNNILTIHSNTFTGENYRFYPNSELFLKQIIKAVPLILSNDEQYNHITTYKQIYHIVYNAFGTTNVNFSNYLKLFLGNKNQLIAFQQRLTLLPEKPFISSNPTVAPINRLKELKIPERFPKLFSYLVQIKEKGIPNYVMLSSRFQPRVSQFKISGYKESSIRLKIVNSLKINGHIQEISYGDIIKKNGVDPYIFELINNCQISKYVFSDLEKGGFPSHNAVAERLLDIYKISLGIEIPFWKSLGLGLYLLGHVDLLQIWDGILSIIDYKPEKSFFRFLPQVCIYGRLVKEMFLIKDVWCVLFNRFKGWVFKPEILLNELRSLLIKYGIKRTWERYI